MEDKAAVDMVVVGDKAAVDRLVVVDMDSDS